VLPVDFEAEKMEIEVARFLYVEDPEHGNDLGELHCQLLKYR
jgi:hypothetical protein